MGHLAAAVDAEQGQGRIRRIEAQVGRVGAAAEGVAGLVFEQQHRLGGLTILQQPRLVLPLPLPGAGERHRCRRFEKNCGAAAGHGHRSLA
jgi:hypothetical protein